MIHRSLLVFCLLTSIILGLDSDSIRVKSPKRAALYALLFPGGGQVYNGKYWKAVLILGLEGITIWRWSENASLYSTYDINDKNKFPLREQRYLEKRNKYAWWIGFIYVYGLIDAVVDAHLDRFDAIMAEDIESKEETIKEYGAGL